MTSKLCSSVAFCTLDKLLLCIRAFYRVSLPRHCLTQSDLDPQAEWLPSIVLRTSIIISCYCTRSIPGLSVCECIDADELSWTNLSQMHVYARTFHDLQLVADPIGPCSSAPRSEVNSNAMCQYQRVTHIVVSHINDNGRITSPDTVQPLMLSSRTVRRSRASTWTGSGPVQRSHFLPPLARHPQPLLVQWPVQSWQW